MGNTIMSAKEVQRVPVFESLQRKEVSQKNAATLMGLSERQVRRKLRLFKTHGLVGLTHKNRGCSSNKKWNPEHRALAIELLRGDWIGFGPTFAAEKLEEWHSIKVSKETLRKAMIEDGVWKKKDRTIKHRKRRGRMVCFGIMIQLDGSKHDWFEGRGPSCTLLVFIDDATSKIVWLEFAKSESLESVIKATKHYFEHYGLPHSFYTDYGSVFSINTNNPDREKITQYERMMKELEVKMIHAQSPQAKGRVERSNKTHQDRLIKEMRLRNISSIEAANTYLQNHYMNEHNIRFAQAPADSTNVHRSIKGIDLDKVMCIKEERVLCNDFTITFNKRIFQLEEQQKTIIRPKNCIMVNVHLNGAITLSIRSIQLDFKEIAIRPQTHPKTKGVKEHKPRKPSENSYRWNSGLPPQQKSLQSSAVGRVG